MFGGQASSIGLWATIELDNFTTHTVVDGEYSFTERYNSRNRFLKEDVGGDITVEYSGTRWEINQDVGGTPTLKYYNESTAEDPPETGWKDDSDVLDSNATVTATGIIVEPAATDNWPGLVVLHQERLVFSRLTNKRQTLVFSQTSLYENFAPTNDKNEVLDDSSFIYTISGSRSLDEVQWLLSATQLVIGTSGGEFISKTSNTTDPITPTNIAFVRQSTRGSKSYQQPQYVAGLVIYIQRLGNIVRGMAYDLASDRFKSIDLTKFADDILSANGGFIEASYLPEPSSILYYTTGNGKVATLTLEEEDQVQAWSLQDFGGTVKGTAILPDAETRYDLYILVERSINGNTVQYIEKQAAVSSDPNYWHYLDCALTYHNDSVAISTAPGLDHLEDEIVSIFADGEYRGTATVSGGQVSLGGAYNHVIVGLQYTTRVQLLDADIVSDGVVTFGKNKRVCNLAFKLIDTVNISVGSSLSNLYVPANLESGLNNGVFSYEIDEDTEIDAGDLYIVDMSPTPFTLALVVREVEFRA